MRGIPAGYASVLARDFPRRAAGSDRLLLDGSLLKVDLSGFTRLSERLAQAVDTGAEELNAVLDQVFSSLIEEILRRDGDVLQFGGDALAVWFEGTCHQHRAAAAAAAMHRVIRTRPAERTPAGPVRLRMSAGAESGRFLFVLTGSDHQELLVLGPAVGAVMRLESAAASGQTLIGPELAAALPAAARAGDQVILLRPAGLGADPAAATPRRPRRGAAALLPPEVRELLRAGPVVGEHRRVAVAFIRLTGVDRLLARRGPAEVAARVDRVTRAVERAISTTGVCWTATDLADDGPVYLLYAGAPTAHEDDAERMLRACRIVADGTRGLPVQAGATLGRAFAGVIGHPERRAYAVLGDTTNVAARVMSSAAAGEARVTAALAQRAAGAHALHPLPALTAKGRRQPVDVLRLGRRSAAGAGSAPGRDPSDAAAPLIGREPELSRLRRLLDDLVRGRPAAPVLVVGPAGQGKSRLVAELARDAAPLPVQVLHGRASALERALPYAAVRSELRRLLRVTGRRVPGRVIDWCADQRHLAGLLALPLGVVIEASPQVQALDPRFVSARRDELLARVLRQAVGGPLLVVLEDLHDADEGTLGLLGALRGLPDVAVLANARPSVPAPAGIDGWQELALAPLDPGAARDLALTVAGDRALDDDQLDRMLAEAGGNPLFLAELVRYAGAVSSVATSLPESAERVVAARIDTLPMALRTRVRECAVAGPVVDLPLMAEVLADPGLVDPRGWSAAAEFIQVQGSTLTFRHDLYRQGAYHGLAVRRRRSVHGALADRLADLGESEPATLALHLSMAERYREAAEQGRVAAARARDAGALADALRLFEAASADGRKAGWTPRRLAGLGEQAADLADLLGRYEVADRGYREALRSSTPARRATLMVKRASVLERRGAYRQALGLLTQAERIGSAGVRRAARLRRSVVHHRQGRLRLSLVEARSVAGQAALARDREDRARALLRMEMVASELGLPERFAYGEEALRAFDGLSTARDLASLLGNLGVTAWEADDWGLALARQEQAVRVYREAGDVIGQAISVNNAAEIRCDQGLLGEAESGFLEARRQFRAAGHAFAAATSSSLGRIAARNGDVAAARELLGEAVDAFSGMGSPVLAADARARQVEVALLAGDPAAVDAAVAVRAEVDALSVGSVLPATVRRYQGIAELQRGHEDAGRASLGEALELARGSRALYEEYLCLDALLGLDALRGNEIDADRQSRRDEVAIRLGIVDTPTYPPLLAVPGPGRRTG